MSAWDVFAPSFGADTQLGVMLEAFFNAGPVGLTDDVAAEHAGLGFGIASSPWKRASELREYGLIAVCIDGHGDPITRQGLRGVERMVSAITDYGVDYWKELS